MVVVVLGKLSALPRPMASRSMILVSPKSSLPTRQPSKGTDMKFFTKHRFNYIDIVAVAGTVAMMMEEMYLWAFITLVLGTLLALVLESLYGTK